MLTIPRAEIHAVMRRYGDQRFVQDEPVEIVHRIADGLRGDAATFSETDSSHALLLAEADALDALVDRIEREAA